MGVPCQRTLVDQVADLMIPRDGDDLDPLVVRQLLFDCLEPVGEIFDRPRRIFARLQQSGGTIEHIFERFDVRIALPRRDLRGPCGDRNKLKAWHCVHDPLP